MRIIAIGAHLDDIELACGGTIAKAIKNGHQVKMIVMSDSAYSNYDGTVRRTKENAIKEGMLAAGKLGVEDIEILDFSTKDIPYHSKTVEALDKLISDFKPDIIFTHWPFDTHQAHEGVSKSSISAARRQGTIYLYEPITPSGRSYVAFRPQAYSDISGFIDDKINSLMEHKTEFNKYGIGWIEGVKARAAFRGYEMGTGFAEAFEVLRCELDFEGNK